MLDDNAAFSIQDWWEGNELIYWSIVPHLYNALKLLDESSISSKGIVLHIKSAQYYSFFLHMINNFDFIVALGTISESIVNDTAIKPSLIVENVPLGIIIIFDWVC